MPDVFDFITTRDTVEEPFGLTGSLPDLKPVPLINLIPTIPANYRVNGTVKDTSSLLDSLAQRIGALPDSRPAYQYTARQEKRYSNPNMQYTPSNVLGADTEDIYGRRQGSGEQLLNSIVKFGANTVGTFASSFLTIPRQLDAVRSGNFNEFFNDDGMFEGVQNWLTGLEDKFPNYYTEWEREHPYKSAIPFSGGSVNFWGDKLLKNAGFTIGGLASGLVVDAAIELATAGTATPAAFLSVANHLNQAKNRMFSAMRGLNKAAMAGKVDDVVKAAKVSDLYKGIQANQIPLKTGFRYAATTYFGAQGESFIEGYHTYLDTKKQLLEEAINRGETDPQTLGEIEQRAQDAGRLTTAFNLPVLMVSNLLQFPNLLYGKGAFAKSNPFIKSVLGKEGLEVVNNYSLKKDLKRWALESFKDSSAEGLEEASQYFISNSLHDYYVDRLNPNTKKPLLDFVIDNAPKVLNDPHLYEEAFLGALSGFVMGAPGSFYKKVTGGDKARHEQLAANLNNVYERLNKTAKDFTNNIELNNLTKPEETQIAAHKALYSTVHDSLKFGSFDSFLDSLEDLKTIDLDSYNQTFQINFQDELEKLAHIQSLIEETLNVKKDIEQVNRFYPTNPYTNSYLSRKVRDAFSDKSETEINNIQENLFQEFKEVVGYNQSLQRITKGKILATETSLKNLGIKTESIEYLRNLSQSPKGLFQYSRWKKTQIEDLRKNKEYYEKLVKEGTDESLKPIEELENVTKRLQEVESFYNRVDKLYQKFVKDPKNQDLQNEILAEVLYEETDEEQREKYKEERIKQAKEFEQQNQTQAKLKDEEVDLNEEQSKTAEQIIDLNKEAEDNKKEIPEPVPEPQIRKNSWMNKYDEGSVIDHKGQSFIIQAKTEDGLIVKDSTGTEYLVTNEKGKLKFTSSIGEMGVSETISVKEEVSQSGKVDTKFIRENNKKIILDLLNNEGDIEKTLLENGFIKLRGFLVDKNAVDTFNKLSDTTIDLLKNNGIVFINNLSHEIAGGIAQGYKYGNREFLGLGLADLGLHHNPNHIALHELGHVIWDKQPKEVQDLFYDGKPITEHGKKVLNPTGRFRDLYGEGSMYGEEDFAELFAENNGNLSNTLNVKRQSKMTEEVQVPQIIEPLEQPSVEQITKPEVKEKLTLGQEEFTWEQIFNQLDSVWVPVNTGFESSFVYSKEGDSLKKRNFTDNNIGNKKYTFREGDKQPNYIKGNFVQLIRGDEVIISMNQEQSIKTELETQIKSFLGKNYSESYAKILETNINLGKIDLIC